MQQNEMMGTERKKPEDQALTKVPVGSPTIKKPRAAKMETVDKKIQTGVINEEVIAILLSISSPCCIKK